MNINFKGIKLLQDKFHKVLEANGLTAIKTVGEKFNPMAHEAVEMVRRNAYDFILLDIMLDNDMTDGIGVSQQIQDAGINTPTAFLSSMTQETLADEQKERVKNLNNIKFYQTKPIAPLELIQKIKDVTG